MRFLYLIPNEVEVIPFPPPPVPDGRGTHLERGYALAAQAAGDKITAQQRYQQFLALWKNADIDRPEVTAAKEFLAKTGVAAQ
jgi:hypothetical protein